NLTSSTQGAMDEVDITSTVEAKVGSLMSLALDETPTNADGYQFNSKENATNRLELRVSWAGAGGTGTPTPTPTIGPTPTITATPGPTPPPGSSFSFGAAGDWGQNSNTTAVLTALKNSGANF